MFIVSGSLILTTSIKYLTAQGDFYIKLEKKARMMDSCPPWSLCIKEHGNHQNLLERDKTPQ